MENSTAEPSSSKANPTANAAVVVNCVPDPQSAFAFQRRALAEYPPTSITADSLGEAEADDGHRYYIKGDAHGRPVRASEWICSRLGERVGVAVPQVISIKLASKEVVFGSRRVTGVADSISTMNFLLTKTEGAHSNVVGMGALISSIFAFDMFVNNDDRHLGNYLSVDDGGQRRFFAFDFSRALFWEWPWAGFPAGNTQNCGRLLRARHGFDLTAAAGVLDRLSLVTASDMGVIINEMPPGWLTGSLQTELLDWWGSSKRADRIEALKEGMSDGTLL